MAELGWPPPIRIKIRKYRSRRLIQRFKAGLVKAAIAARATLGIFLFALLSLFGVA